MKTTFQRQTAHDLKMRAHTHTCLRKWHTSPAANQQILTPLCILKNEMWVFGAINIFLSSKRKKVFSDIMMIYLPQSDVIWKIFPVPTPAWFFFFNYHLVCNLEEIITSISVVWLILCLNSRISVSIRESRLWCSLIFLHWHQYGVYTEHPGEDFHSFLVKLHKDTEFPT